MRLAASSFLLIALAARAATYKVWERAQSKDEHLFWLIAPALAGATLGGIFLSVSTHTALQPLSPLMWSAMLLVAIVGLTGYFYMNTVMALLGAFYTRVVELWQVPMLWAIHLLTDHAPAGMTAGCAWRAGRLRLRLRLPETPPRPGSK